MATYENRSFSSGQMDRDTDPHFVENGKYTYALNIRPYNTESGNVGIVTNVEGNEQVAYTFSGLDANPYIKCIGSKLDLKRRRVYWLVYGQNNGSDQYAYVLYYSYETGDITTVFSHENILDFNPDFTISDINIIYDNEIGDTLFWTDRNSEPKQLNVDAGVNRFNNYTTATTGFSAGDIVFADTATEFNAALQFFPCQALTSTNTFPEYDYSTGELNTTDFEIIPVGQCYPPFLVATMFYQKEPSPYWSPSSTYRYNDGTEDVEGVATFLRRRSFQFCYAYVYFNGQQSELSPFSEAVFSQELTSGIFTVGATTANPDFPTPQSISVKVPIHSYRYTDISDIKSVVEQPHAMIARVKLFIREVPTTKTPTDWLEWQDIPYEEFYKYNISNSNISNNFPVAGEAGTYYYDWFSRSYAQSPSGQTSAITTITVEYDGTQTLIPIDAKYATTNSYFAPKKSNTQDVIDNRLVHAGVTRGMNISKDVIKSIEDNVSVDPLTTNPTIEADPTVNTINFYNSSPSSESYNDGTNTYTGVFELDSPLVVGDFDTLFQYSYTIRVNFKTAGNVTLFAKEVDVSGSTSGIPDDFADFETFIEDVTPQEDTFTVSVNNATGEMTVTAIGGGTQITQANAVIKSTTNEGFFSVDTYLPYRTFKNHSQQQFGFVFTDDAGRPSPVITGDWATINFPHFIDNLDRPQVFQAIISNLSLIDVPSDARTLSIVRKRSQSYSNFIQFSLSETNCPTGDWNHDSMYEVGFINLELDEPNPETINQNKNLYITLNAVNGGDGRAYESVFDTSILDFLPQEGDVLRFLYKIDISGNIDEVYEASFNIEKYDERTNTIVVNFEDIEENEPTLATYLEDTTGSDARGQVRLLCEVIQKPKTSDQEFYWEVAAQLSCTDGAVDISSNLFQGAIPIFGDTYLKLRGYCTNYNGNDSDIFQNFVLQDPNFNDFAPTNSVGEGRPNLQVKTLRRGQNEYVEITSDNLIRYSEQTIQNTDARRFANFYDTNIQEVDNIFGRIEKIYAEGDKLNVYQEDKMSLVYVGRGVTTELSGDQRIIASQNNVFSDVIYNPYNGGISIDGDSFAAAGYQKYFTDSKRGMVYRQSMDGITPISEVGMSGDFKDIFRDIRNSFTTPIIRGIVDERINEYILSLTYTKAIDVEVFDVTALQFSFSRPEEGVQYVTFADDQRVLIDIDPLVKYTPEEFTALGNETEEGVTTIQIKPGSPLENGDTIRVSFPVNNTLIFSERTGGWTTFLSYTAEWLSEGIQSYHTFFNGEMWLHDLGNINYNTFFGTEYPSEIESVSNRDPQIVKEWRTMAVKSKFPNLSVETGGITTSDDMVSEIPNASFKLLEGHQKSTFYRDATFSLTQGPRLKGDWLQMRVTANTPEVNEQRLKILALLFNSNNSEFSR